MLSINATVWRISKNVMILLSKFGDLIKLGFNSERLDKLTQNYIVSNQKLLIAIRKGLPINAVDSMKNTLKSFN